MVLYTKNEGSGVFGYSCNDGISSIPLHYENLANGIENFLDPTLNPPLDRFTGSPNLSLINGADGFELNKHVLYALLKSPDSPV